MKLGFPLQTNILFLEYFANVLTWRYIESQLVLVLQKYNVSF